MYTGLSYDHVIRPTPNRAAAFARLSPHMHAGVIAACATREWPLNGRIKPPESNRPTNLH